MQIAIEGPHLINIEILSTFKQTNLNPYLLNFFWGGGGGKREMREMGEMGRVAGGRDGEGGRWGGWQVGEMGRVADEGDGEMSDCYIDPCCDHLHLKGMCGSTIRVFILSVDGVP